MASIRDVVTYICHHYPSGHELSKARITKMVYLVDWRSALQQGTQVTSIEWKFNHFGPYVTDVVDAIREDPAFQVEQSKNTLGNKKETIRLILKEEPQDWGFSGEEKDAIDHVIRVTQNQSWTEFIGLVYSTYPVLTQPRYADLNLVVLATEYRKLSPTELDRIRIVPA